MNFSVLRISTMLLLGALLPGCTEMARAIVNSPPVLAGIHTARAANLAQERNYSGAILEYTLALRATPDSGIILDSRGRCYLAIRQYDLALRDFAQALKITPQGPGFARLRSDLWRESAGANAFKGDVRAMWRDFDLAIQADPSDVGNYLARADQYQVRGKKRSALSDYSRAISLQPNLEQLYVSRGYLLDDMGEHVQAVSDYTKALTIKSDDANALNDRCFSLTIAGRDLDKALKDCNASLALSGTPNFRFYPLSSRALTYLKLHRYREALADANAALAITPRDADSHYLRGKAEIALGDTRNGNRDIDVAETLSKQRGSFYRTYGLK